VRYQPEYVGTLGVSGGHVGSLKVYVGSAGSSDGNSDLAPASVSPLLSVSAEIATFNGPKSSLAGHHHSQSCLCSSQCAHIADTCTTRMCTLALCTQCTQSLMSMSTISSCPFFGNRMKGQKSFSELPQLKRPGLYFYIPGCPCPAQLSRCCPSCLETIYAFQRVTRSP
jgi:hypothetical protein